MADPASTLETLLAELTAERSLRRRVDLLARSWRLVRSLAPDQRERLVLALGSKLAWRELERLFLRDGELSQGERSVQRALERTHRADPQEIRAMARAIRKRDWREGWGRLSRIIAEEAAEDLEPIPPDEIEPVPEPEFELEPELETAPEPEPSPVPVPPAPAAEARVEGSQRPAPAIEEQTQPPDRTGPVLRPAPEAPAPPVEPAVRPPPEPIPAAEPSHAPGAPPPEPPTGAPFEAGATRGAAASARERLELLRSLRSRKGAARALGVEGRARLVDRLGSGWAARRALSQMIRARALEDVEEALRLIGRLDSPASRTWCLGDLLEGWELGAAGVERILAAAPTPAARRRLARRAAREGAAPRG